MSTGCGASATRCTPRRAPPAATGWRPAATCRPSCWTTRRPSPSPSVSAPRPAARSRGSRRPGPGPGQAGAGPARPAAGPARCRVVGHRGRAAARSRVDPGLLSDLAAAARDHHRLRFDYTRHDGTTGRRTVEPLRLVHAGTTWYLVAWDADRAGWRTFRVDRVASAPVAVAQFTPRPPPADDLAAWVAEGAAVRAYPARGGGHAPRPGRAGGRTPLPDRRRAGGPRRPHVPLDHRGPTLGALAFHVVNVGVEFTVVAPELVDHLRALAGLLLRAADVPPGPEGPLA